MRKRSVPVLLPTLLILGLLGAWAGTSMGQLPPPPVTVSVPTVTVPLPPAPPPPIPTVSTPKVPLPPPPPPPVEVPKAPVEVPKPPVDVPKTPLPVSVPSPQPAPQSETEYGPTGAPSYGSGSSSASGVRLSGASSRIRTIRNVRTSRAWLIPSRKADARAGVWITFWLSRAGTVIFFVDRIAPDCRYVGKFLVRAQAGRNSIRFRGRLRGRPLDPGTYRLTARARRNPDARVTGTTLVILERETAPAEISAAEARNTCPGGIVASLRGKGADALAAAGVTGGGDGSVGGAGGVAGVQATAAPRRAYEDEPRGPIASAVETIEAAATSVPGVLIALALLAVLLLGVAAMPQPIKASRTGAALVHHRGAIAVAGVGALLAAVVSFSLL